MNILIIGSGGREHALAWKVAQSPMVSKLFITPGNAGTEGLCHLLEVDWNDSKRLKEALLVHAIDIVLVGPEIPLVGGIHDVIRSDKELEHVVVIGPTQKGAMLEGSKEFAKAFMQKNQIPTARYQAFRKENLKEAIDYLKKMSAPYVLKADGLAAGKGVLIVHDIQEAISELEKMFSGKFGSAGECVVIEEFLEGIELSVFILTDGKEYILLPEAKDYKRIGEGDTGLNTGGMGAVSPVPFADKGFMEKVEQRIIRPTLNGLRRENIPYQGFIFFGLINVEGEPYVIEYNVRLGDPETEAIMLRLDSDLVPLLQAVGSGTLGNHQVQFKKEAACTVMLVSGGYPEEYETGKRISFPATVNESVVFHAGTKRNKEGEIVTNGGRVLSISSCAKTLQLALSKSLSLAQQIDFEGKYFRSDIGFDV